jgi:hypothetical protein
VVLRNYERYMNKMLNMGAEFVDSEIFKKYI